MARFYMYFFIIPIHYNQLFITLYKCLKNKSKNSQKALVQTMTTQKHIKKAYNSLKN
jgi:hypothetical protein